VSRAGNARAWLASKAGRGREVDDRNNHTGRGHRAEGRSGLAHRRPRIAIEDLFVLEGVDEHEGLTSAEAASRRETYGPNRMAEAAREPAWRAFLRQYADPMQIVLLVAGLLSLWPVKQYGTALVIMGLTLFNAVIGLHQEGKAAAAVDALQKMMIIKAKVRRDGAMAELPAEELVPGDVVSIEAGDVIPADGRITHAATLEVAESALTGESVPVSKGAEAVASPDTPLGDRSDMVYMNTSVTRGSGEFVVTATGMATEVGHISRLLQAEHEKKSPLTPRSRRYPRACPRSLRRSSRWARNCSPRQARS
jgi:Ca2+-transporting ATPase